MTIKKVFPVYDVYVGSSSKGTVFKLRNQWRWEVQPRGTETYKRGTTFNEITDHIAAVCRADASNVILQYRNPRIREAMNRKAQSILDMMTSGRDSEIIKKAILDAMHWARIQ